MSFPALCLCERCQLVKPVGRVTLDEVKWIQYTEENGTDNNGDRRITAHRKDIGEKRALCRDCWSTISIARYDAAHQNPEPLTPDSQ